MSVTLLKDSPPLMPLDTNCWQLKKAGLNAAIDHCSLDALKSLLEEDDISSVLEAGLWHKAVESGFTSAYSLLSEQGLNINSLNQAKQSPLSLAVAKGDINSMAELIHLGADINQNEILLKKEDALKALDLSVQKGCYKCACKFLEKIAPELQPKYYQVSLPWLFSSKKIPFKLEIHNEISKFCKKHFALTVYDILNTEAKSPQKIQQIRYITRLSSPLASTDLKYTLSPYLMISECYERAEPLIEYVYHCLREHTMSQVRGFLEEMQIVKKK